MTRSLVLPLLVGLSFGCRDSNIDSVSGPTLECDACGGACSIENLEVGTANHTSDPIDYPNPPPVGGPHNPCWSQWLVFSEEIPDERWVHNLEHGGVVFLYDCPDGCPDDVAVLQAIYDARPQHTVVVSPYAGLNGGFAAVSWGWRMLLDCADADTLNQFYDEHADHGPESSTSNPPESCDP